MELKTNEWKEFRVGDWFSYDRGKESAPNQNINGNTWIISETSENNGYVRKVEPTQIFDGGCITVSVNFAQIVHYQPTPFCASVNIIIIKPLSDKIKKRHMLFIASVLTKQHKIYSYTNKISKDLLMDELILLPAKLNATKETYEPDWAYMEEYIKYIEDKYIERVDEQNKKRIKEALVYCGLSEKDLEGELKLPEVEKYEDFKVGDWFDTESGDTDIKQGDINNKGEITITSGVDNYGMLGRTDVKAKVISKDTITIDMFGNVFYRPYNYKMVTHARVFALIPKFKMNYRIGLFICSILFYLKDQYGYSHMCSYNKIKREMLSLPAIDKNTPDFETMERYIYIYTKRRIKDWKMAGEKEVELLRKLVKGEKP